MTEVKSQQNIPSGWQEKCLANFLVIEKGKLPRKTYEVADENSVPYLSIKHLDGAEFKYAHKSDGVIADKDDLLVIADGSGSGRMYRGYYGLVSSTFLKISSQSPSEISNDYLEVLFSHLDFTKSRFRKGGAIPHFDFKQLKDVDILLPPIKEQQKIAEILGSVDEDIAKTQEVIEVTEKLKHGLMQQLFTRGIGHTKFKETKIGQIPEGWEVGELGSYLLRNPDYGINAAGVDYTKKLPTYIRITDISDDGKFISKNKKSVDHKDSENYLLQEGDLLFARTGASVGKTYLYNPDDGKLVFAGFLIRARADKEKLLAKYLSYFVQTPMYWNWVRMMSTRSGQPGINGNEYAGMIISVPPLSEQEKYIEILSAIDEKISVNKKLKEKLTLLKKGLMQDLLSGVKRVII
ncbi:MAG TPA: restriction endonuclease subunit S [Candidatus Paceibacterota bacterium]|nr:restriction endonuclease subunit S [Candidatus Paceibacterota bacterium]